ncbi:hypothetical protein SteCoe_17109 [Stentor coeruleus]|uniref:Uncharacterized protein n=1 Tax=Stentor coeruleus TaxID=5963 RepID=A0A1R2BZU2_9CILI|nr:hypothetical protein SteCoe_17109 [Stentor coeruleus]
MDQDLSDTFGCGYKDIRNRRGGNKDPKKRLNRKEYRERAGHILSRKLQSNNAGPSAEELKQEYDEINQEYLKMLERKRKEEMAAKKAEEKKNNFEKDFIDHALGPKPKYENKIKVYDEKVKCLSEDLKIKNSAKNIDSKQRTVLLNYMKSVVCN